MSRLAAGRDRQLAQSVDDAAGLIPIRRVYPGFARGSLVVLDGTGLTSERLGDEARGWLVRTESAFSGTASFLPIHTDGASTRRRFTVPGRVRACRQDDLGQERCGLGRLR
jgi:hypothetical protein